VLFYYSGHGAQLNGTNYLVPVDFRGSDAIALKNRSFLLSEVLERMSTSGAAFKFVFLDSCRDNPYFSSLPVSSRSNSTDLPNLGFYIAFSTSSDERASDGRKGTNGLFTGILSRALAAAVPGDTIDTVMQAVNTKMGNQVPWIHQNLAAPWYPRGEREVRIPVVPPEVAEAARAQYELGNRAMVEGSYTEAVRLFSAAIRLNPQDSSTYLARGVAQGILGSRTEELADFSKAIELKPNDPVAFLSRALAYRRGGDCPNALRDLDETLRLRPDFAAALRHRGACLEKAGATARAEKDYAEAVRRNPRDAESREMLAALHLRQGKAELARKEYDELVKLRTSSPRAWRGLAAAQEALGDVQGAAKSRSMATQGTAVKQ
jgi:tetratricopeptide (TPR) repeat protein